MAAASSLQEEQRGKCSDFAEFQPCRHCVELLMLTKWPGKRV